MITQEQSDELIDILAESNPEALLADGFERALVGITEGPFDPIRAVYSYQACIQVLVSRDGMSEEDADEFISFNTTGAYVGEHGPIFIHVYS